MNRILLFGLFLLLSGMTQAQSVSLDVGFYTPETESTPFDHSMGGEVRNVILFIGDGMGLAHVTLSRLYAVGPDGRLTIDRFPVTGLISTHSADDLITDSAAAATALSTGVKTDKRVIGLDSEGQPLVTIVQKMQSVGKSTGLVATSTITHATPAGFGAHRKSRSDEQNIAVDLAESGIDILFGGGREFFLPKAESGSGRKDERNLLGEMSGKGYTIISTRDELLAVDDKKVVGLFHNKALQNTEEEPALREMTATAIQLLSRNPSGFFLMVEGSQVDWAGHDKDPNGVVFHTLHFDLAVREGIEFARQDGNTLVIVTADHETGGLSIVGGGRQGRPLHAAFSTGSHTAIPVPVYAYGPGALEFTGTLDNTSIPRIIARLAGVNDGVSEAVAP